MRFTGTIVTDEKDTLIINDFLQSELGKHIDSQFICHIIRHDIAFNEPGFLILIICRRKLNDAFDRIEAYKFRILHYGSSSLNAVKCILVDVVALEIRKSWLCKFQAILSESSTP